CLEEALPAIVVVDVEDTALTLPALGGKAPDVVVDLPVGADGRIEGISGAVAEDDIQIPVGGQEGGSHPGVGEDAVSSDFAFRLMPAFGDRAIVPQMQPEAALAGIVMVGIVVIRRAGTAGEGVAVVQT